MHRKRSLARISSSSTSRIKSRLPQTLAYYTNHNSNHNFFSRALNADASTSYSTYLPRGHYESLKRSNIQQPRCIQNKMIGASGRNGRSEFKRCFATNSTLESPKSRRTQQKEMPEELVSRAVTLTPWRGSPTFLHAAAFLEELERRYGKISWAGLSRNSANPYEYRPIILVIFEDKSSLEKIPGLNTQPSNPAYQPSSASQSPSPPQNSIDDANEFMPRTEAAPTKNPYDFSPIFVAWSDSLNEAATQPGGPSFEDISQFLKFETPVNQEERQIGVYEALSSQTSDRPLSWQEEEEEEDKRNLESRGQKSAQVDRPTWAEYDEVVHLDAIVRPVPYSRLFLPLPRRELPYFAPRRRINVANAIIEFAGFAPKPVEQMQTVIDFWKGELELNDMKPWQKYDEGTENVIAAQTVDNEEGDLDSKDQQTKVEELSSEDNGIAEELGTFFPSRNLTYADDVDDSGLNPQRREQNYQRIATEDDANEDEWEGLGMHPLQFPPPGRKNENDGLLNFINEAQSIVQANGSEPATGGDIRHHPYSGQTSEEEPVVESRSSQQSSSAQSSTTSNAATWDTWRTDPRPFRNGLGGDGVGPGLYRNMHDKDSMQTGSGVTVEGRASLSSAKGAEDVNRYEYVNGVKVKVKAKAKADVNVNAESEERTHRRVRVQSSQIENLKQYERDQREKGENGQKKGEWTKPGLPSPGAMQRAAVLMGAHSPKSQGWDMKGRKAKNKEVMFASHRPHEEQEQESVVAQGSSFGWSAGEVDSVDRRVESKVRAAQEDQRMKQRDRVRNRLRAILDGTDVD